MSKIKVYTGTVKDNVYRALDPITFIYDKIRVKDVSHFPDLYVHHEHREAILAALGNEKNTGLEPVVLSGEVDSSELSVVPCYRDFRRGFIVSSKCMKVDGIYQVKFESWCDNETPLKDCKGIKDITDEFLN